MIQWGSTTQNGRYVEAGATVDSDIEHPPSHSRVAGLSATNPRGLLKSKIFLGLWKLARLWTRTLRRKVKSKSSLIQHTIHPFYHTNGRVVEAGATVDSDIAPSNMTNGIEDKINVQPLNPNPSTQQTEPEPINPLSQNTESEPHNPKY